MRAAAEAEQPAIAPPVASLGSLRMIAVEHRAHMQKQQQGVVGQQLRWYVYFFVKSHLASKPSSYKLYGIAQQTAGQF